MLTIYDSNGNRRTDIEAGDSSTQVKEVQGDNVLTLSFTHYEYIALDVNDRVDFEGERYWLTERYAPKLRDTIVMETGGMKGRREELPKEEFHRILCEAFGVDRVHSEYGMAELTSQAYSDGGGRFRTPGWMRVAVRDVNDPFCRLLPDQRGGVDIIDLANRFSCAFIQTQDVGRVSADGSFRIEGRIDHSDIRGCNLLVQ